MIPDYFAIICAVIASLGGFYYLYETIIGTSQPNRVTWLLWGLFPMITFVAQRAQGVEGVSWITFASGFTPILIVIASFFNKKAYWESSKLDYACMVVAFLGIILWAFTKNPNLAIFFSILADFAAAIPTVIKAKKYPHSESWQAFAISSVGFGIGLLAVQQWNFQNAAFVVYLFTLNSLIAVLAFQRPQKEIKI